MIHGKLIRLYKDRIVLPDDLLHPLGFKPGTNVSGFLYLRPNSKEYEHLSLKVDLGLTPLPHRLWPFLARISVYLLHQSGSLHEIARILESNNINILSANVVRFGHRYAEWDMVLDISDYRDPETNEVTKERKWEYEDFRRIVGGLAESILAEDKARKKSAEDGTRKGGEQLPTPKDHGVFLFHDLLEDMPIKAMPLVLLWDHFYRIERSAHDTSGSNLLFHGHCEGNAIKLGGREWDAVLVEAGLRSDLLTESLFCHCIGAFDSKSQTLRVAVIPEALRNRFRRFTITYDRENPSTKPDWPRNTQGMLRRVTECLKDVNMWWMTNQTMKNEPQAEEGEIQVLVELYRKDPIEKFSELEARLRDSKSGFSENVKIRHVGAIGLGDPKEGNS